MTKKQKFEIDNNNIWYEVKNIYSNIVNTNELEIWHFIKFLQPNILEKLL